MQNYKFVEQNRIKWIDFAKGITILLTIVGHSVGYNQSALGNFLRGMIFSFHMPLFFILSCVTYNCSASLDEWKRKTIKSCKHLIFPAFVVFFLFTVWQCLHNSSLLFDLNYWHSKFYTLLFASGVDLALDNLSVAAIRIPWFFFALFFGRSIFDYLHLQCKNQSGMLFILSTVLGMQGILWGRTQWLPFSLDIALAIIPFFFFGNYLKDISVAENSFIKACIFGFLWLLTFCITFPNYNIWTYLELAVRRYDFFPICYLTAILGTMFVAELSVIFCKISFISKPITYIGKNSLYLLCIHAFEDNLYDPYRYLPERELLTALERTAADVAVFLLFMLCLSALNKAWKTWNLRKTSCKE